MRPEAMISELRVASFGEYSIVKNKVTFGQSEFDHEWLNSTKIKLTPKNLPSSSLWDQEGCEGIVESGERKEKVRFQNHKQYEFSISQFHPVKVTCESNGFTKVFDFFQPFGNVKFTNMHKPVIRITNSKERGKIPFSFQLSSGDKILRKKEKFGTPSAKNTVVDDIPIPLEWYRNLENEGILTFEIWTDNGSYEDSFDIEVSPPELSFFRPKPVNVKTIVSATEGYVVGFELEPLSPKMKNFDASFIQENGTETTFKVDNGKVRMAIPPNLEQNSTLNDVRGELQLEHYYKKDDMLEFEFSFTEYATVTCKNSVKRTSNENVFSIASTPQFRGSATVQFKDGEIDLKRLSSDEKQIDYDDQFEFSIGSETSYSVSQIREKLTSIDPYFLQLYPNKITLQLVIEPFGNVEKFGQHIVDFDILRDDDFLTETVAPFYLEGEDELCWRFGINDLYFPDKTKFKIECCGEFIEPKIEGTEEEIMFRFASQEYSTVFENPKWVLNYDEKEVLQGELIIPKILFDSKQDVIDVFYSPSENNYFVSAETIGEFRSEGQKNVNVEISINFTEMKEKEKVTLPIHEVEVLKFNKISDIFSKSQDFLSSLEPGHIGSIQVKIPSRNINLAEIQLRLGNDEFLTKTCRNWLEKGWKKTIKEIEDLSEETRPIVTYLLCERLDRFYSRYGTQVQKWLQPTDDSYKKTRFSSEIRRYFNDYEYITGILDVNGKYATETMDLFVEWHNWFVKNKPMLSNAEVKSKVYHWWGQANKLNELFPNINIPNNLLKDDVGINEYIAWLRVAIHNNPYDSKFIGHVKKEIARYLPPEPSSNPASKVKEPVTENSSEVKEGGTRTMNETVRESVENIKKSNDTVKETAQRSRERKAPRSNSRKSKDMYPNRGRETLENYRKGKRLSPSTKKPKNKSKPRVQPKKKTAVSEKDKEDYFDHKDTLKRAWERAKKAGAAKRIRETKSDYQRHVRNNGAKYGDSL